MSRAEISRALYGKPSAHRGKKHAEDGIVFDSGEERDHYRELKLRQRAGEITKLQCHPTFVFIVNGIKIGKYTPDFQYIDVATNAPVIEDYKGKKRSKKTGKMLPRVNREFGIKRKLMLALFGIDVRVV